MVGKHLLEYQGEADNHGTKINFISWGIKNPDDFVQTTEGFEGTEREKICGLLAFAATDGGADKAFEAAFQEYDTECFRIMRAEIAENREWQQRLKTRPNQ